MAGEPPKPKLTLKQTDTSRLKTDTGRLVKTTDAGQAAKPALPPGAEPPAPATPPAPQQTVRLTDPLEMRDTDTTRLRRMSPEGEKAATGAAVAPGTPAAAPGARKPSTETVRLKVVRDLKQPATPPPEAPSQTARLRPPVLPAKQPAEPAAPPPPPAAQTVSIKAPVLDAAKTQPAEPPGPPEAKTSTSRLQRVGAAAKPATPPAAEAPITPPGEGGAHQTVKIKLPVLDAAEGGEGPAATAVLPPPEAAPGAATVKLEAEAPADTVPKKTIKLRMSPKTEGLPAPAREGAEVAARPTAQAVPATADPLSLAAAIVTLLGVGTMLGILVLQVVAHVL